MPTTDPTIALTLELVARRSLTPEDGGCQALLAERLAGVGFVAESLPFGPVSNSWLRRGEAEPLVVFAGHTDVVPPGDESAWRVPPFAPAVQSGELIGRGASDMKGNLAAFVTATERFVAAHPEHAGSIALLLTSDEEGDGVDGTVKVVEALAARGLDWSRALCVVGEPTSVERPADTIKVGRRGSLGGVLRIRGVQGHVAYPDQARNPVHEALGPLAALVAFDWDSLGGGTDPRFPATSLQISNVAAGTGAVNVIPGELLVHLNLRFGPTVDEMALRQQAERLLAPLDVECSWSCTARPFVTADGPLLAAAVAASEAVTGAAPARSTGGGTSDARFLAAAGAAVIELGCSNATIHATDERVAVDDLQTISRVYEQLLERLLLG